MNKHLLCLTVDTDPDGLSGKETNRQSLNWRGLESLQSLPGELQAARQLSAIPLTWFVRADGQLESILGNAAYLLEKYERFWVNVKSAGHEIAWHPHLYRQSRIEQLVEIISDPHDAQDELERLWSEIRTILPATSFRNGEGWHSPTTYATIETLGFRCDSTVIPGRKGAAGHPMNWEGAPNHPFFPSSADLCKSGPERRLLELPMNTWLIQTPYDVAPKLRYINPAVHTHLFTKTLQAWHSTREISSIQPCVWVMIFHPDEVLSEGREDHLYSRSTKTLCANLLAFQESLQRIEADFEWVTIAEAADRWRKCRGKQVA